MSGVNGNPPATPIALALEDGGGGFIPDAGVFSVRLWSRLLGVDPQTIRRWVKKYRIPYRQPGAEMFIDAADMLRHIPYFGDEEPALE